MHAEQDAYRIAREHGALANVLKSQEQQDDTLQADAATSMRQGAMAERVHVRLRAHTFNSQADLKMSAKLGKKCKSASIMKNHQMTRTHSTAHAIERGVISIATCTKQTKVAANLQVMPKTQA